MPRRLLLGVRRHGRNQRGAGSCRAGVNRNWLGGRRRGGQHFRRLQRRRLRPGGEKRDRGVAVICAAGVAGNRAFILVARRSVTLSAAHFVVQIRRRGVERHEIVHGAERGPQPRQRGVGKAALEHLGGLHRAGVAGRSAEHHRDQPFAAPRGGGDEVVAGGTDEAGLEAVGAGIAADQLVEILRDPAAVTNRGNVHEIFVFRQIANDRPRQHRQIARRGDLAVGGQTVGVDVTCLRHAELLRGLVHFRRETIDRTADALGQHHGHVVGRLHQHHLQRVIDRDLRARPEPHLRGRLRSCDRRYREQRIERKTSFLDGLERDVGRHQFGDGCRIPRMGRVLGLQHLSGIGLDHQKRFRLHDTRRNNRERGDNNQTVQRSFAKQRRKKMHYPIPVLVKAASA